MVTMSALHAACLQAMDDARLGSRKDMASDRWVCRLHSECM